MTQRPHLGGTEAELETAQWVYDTWAQFLDDVNYVPYDVLLSYPSDTQPNLVCKKYLMICCCHALIR